MESIKNFQLISQKLMDISHWVTKERFEKICIETNQQDIRDLWGKYNHGFLYFVASAPEELINGLLNLYDQKEQGVLFATIQEDNDFRKVILTDNTSIEINLKNVEGIIDILKLYNKKQVKTVLRLVDSIYVKDKTTNIYEGDIIRVFDYGKSELFLALIDRTYVNLDSYFVELLYTEKYGYLNPNKKPNKDNIPIKFEQSLFNVRENRYNYHCVTLNEIFTVIGNAMIDLSILNP